MSLTLYRYSGWSIRPAGATTPENARDDCFALMNDADADAVRAIDEETGNCVASVARADDGQLYEDGAV